jgi:hypothetical protein
MRNPEIQKALTVRVTTLNDLVRLSGTLASRMIIMPVYRAPMNEGHVYFLQMMYKDYYKYYGIPVIYYYLDKNDHRSPDKARYILAKTDEAGEKIEISDKTRTGWLVIPIINLDELPEFFELEDG